MVVFHTDLDKTLIYSHRAEIGEDKFCVELYQGREVSFMTDRTRSLLGRIADREGVLIVPTTTRSVEQYERISLPIAPEYALVCNGGVLLRRGVRDESWYEDSLRRILPAKREMEKAKRLMEKDPSRKFELRLVDGIFLFTKSSEPKNMAMRLSKELNLQKVRVFTNREKVYVLPQSLDKGEAAKRFRLLLRRRYPKESFCFVGAGDSPFDIPMLEESDIAFAPSRLAQEGRLSEKIRLFSEERIFSEALLEELEKALG
ncbi:MAG: hypothetical protein Q4A78_02220 [Peptostreptococcaceae bacterium]|nr:hypothetical protein [Peptostreptococcaceae bacterium]